MTVHNKNWFLAAATAGALAFGFSTAGFAQSDAAGMPQEQQQGNASFVSGGVGLDESHALKAAASHWPLAMRFTGPGADYLADVHVRISSAKGGDVLTADARGPYMLVRLPAGQYTVHAKYKDNEQTRSVRISGKGHARADFHWNQE
jgi:hypothetical protein